MNPPATPTTSSTSSATTDKMVAEINPAMSEQDSLVVGTPSKAATPEDVDDEDEEEETSPTKTTTMLCRHCQKRNASKECTEGACPACCTASPSSSDCPKHAALRDKQQWRAAVLAGTTDVQMFAAAKRKALLPKHHTFRECGFVYAGDTVVIWNFKEYYACPRWRDDARRRSVRRQQTAADAALVTLASSSSSSPEQQHHPRRRIKNSRTRFRQWVEQKYQEHLRQTKQQTAE